MTTKKDIIIGVSARITTEGTIREFINENYLQSLINIGLNPIMITANNNDYTKILDMCDCFLITGGDDIDPSYFNQSLNGARGINKDIDTLDKIIITHAINEKKPMLGICRGHQVINVFLGGSLIQDIGTIHSSVRHNVISLENRLINFEKEFETNSYHHQVVDRIADEMIEIAKSVDGYNEALIHKYLPIFSIQWHPEKNPEEKASKLIFQTFKEMINTYLNEK